MVIAALVLLLFLLGFGSMIISHAHREIHIVPKRVQMAVGVFIIFFTSIMVLYLSGYLFSRTMMFGERPFEVGSKALQSFVSGAGSDDRALEQCLTNLNTTLQQQAMQAEADKKLQLEAELKDIKKEIKTIKKETVAVPKVVKTYRSYPKRTYTAKYTTVKTGSAPNTISNLVGYDPSKYTLETEPVLIVTPLTE